MDKFNPTPTALARMTKKQLIQIIQDTQGENNEPAPNQSTPGNDPGIFSKYEDGFKALFERASVGMAILNIDAIYLTVNQAFADIVGHAKADIPGKSVYDIFHPDDLEKTMTIKQALKAGPAKLPSVERRILRPDGDVRWGLITRTPIADEFGDIDFVVSQIQDITDVKEAALDSDRQKILFEAVFKDAPDSMIIVDTNRKVIKCNPAFTAIFGYEESELLGKQAIMLYAKDEDFGRQGDIRFNLDAEEKLKPYEIEYRRKNGKIFTGETIGTVIKDDRNSVLGFISVIRDVSDRKIMQRELIKSENRFRDFARAGADRFWETDEEFRYTYNSAVGGTFFVESKDLAGFRPWEVSCNEAKSEDWENLKKTIAEQKPFRDFRYRHNLGEGRIFHRRVSGIPVFDDQKKFTGYRGLTIDETAAIEAEHKAKTIEQRFSAAIDNLGVGVVLWDSKRQLVACNQYFRDIMGPDAKIIVPGLTFDDFIENRVRSFSQIVSFDSETWASDRLAEWGKNESDAEFLNARGRWIRIQKTLLGDGSQISVHTDFTEAKNREMELTNAKLESDSASRSKSEFLGNVSHELRSPLNAILGFAQIFERSASTITTEKLVAYSGVIRENGTHLLSLINSILDLSAVEAGKIELNEEEVNLEEIIDNSLAILRQRADDVGVSLTNRIDRSVLKIFADPVKIKQILVNLIGNAIKFTPSGGTVELSLGTTDQGAVEFVIEDSGIGMSDTEIVLALEMFGRVRNPKTKNKEGTGLGLPITKGLVEAHGGELSISSVPGDGTRITVNLPKERFIN